ncbi:MAG: hypothetical protein F4210_05965 [Holophagales bacterium]|nr:hypothetical protein [Holophagales bacterium]MYF95043.1 hypothetical protein [Holophagales bacterium]
MAVPLIPIAIGAGAAATYAAIELIRRRRAQPATQLVREAIDSVLSRYPAVPPGGRERNLYVVLLDRSVWREKAKFREKNPHYREENRKPFFYVGETGLKPERRFKRHKRNYQAGRGFVRDFGKRPLVGSASVSADQAKGMEKALARELQARDCGVWWG